MWVARQEAALRPVGRRRRALAVSLVLAVALVLAACGSGDDEPGGDTAAGSGDAATSVTVAPGGPPTPGGTLVYGIEAESAGWDPTADRFSTSGWTVAWTFYDALAAFDEDGNAQPYLARAFEPSEDYRTWTIRLRPDVRFHNGEVLDGAALDLFMEQLLVAPLSSAALANITSVEVPPDDPLAVVVTMDEPWATFPANLTLQAGMVPAPAQLGSTDRAVRSTQPIGTGPFELDDWVTGDNLRVVRNADYWQTDEAGTALPYLDAVEFRIITESVTRQSALVAGDVDIVHMNLAGPTAGLLADAQAGGLQIVFDPGETEEVFILFNTAVAPLDDVRVRQALAAATDVDAYLQTFDIASEQRADGPFVSSSPFYSPEAAAAFRDRTGDPEEAARLLDEYRAETGVQTVAVNLASTPETLDQVSFLAEMWKSAGIEANVVSTEQAVYIQDAVLGNYQANLFRLFASVDLDGDYHLITPDDVAPVGSISLNMARYDNPELGTLLDQGRATADRAERAELYARVQQLWAEDVPYLWLRHVQWAIAARNEVRQFWNNPLPDEEGVDRVPAAPFRAGTHRLTATWIEGER